MKGNHLSIEKKVMILNLLCEGSSMRSASRIVDCSINTVTKVMLETGMKCEMFQKENNRPGVCKEVEVDEIWSFNYAKQKNTSYLKARVAYPGDVWTWTAVCPVSKMVICWRVGRRELRDAKEFMRDLKSRLSERVQLTSDGLNSYVQAVEAAFGGDVHYGILVKNYSVSEGLSLLKKVEIGAPNLDKISTSAVERQNLSMRMGMRRYTRKTNAHSKKIDNHKLALALYFFFHNYIRINSTIRVTPAMAAGITSKVLEWPDILGMAY